MNAAEVLKSIPFPDPRAEARARAAEFQRLSPDERIRQLESLHATGMFMIQQSPNRPAMDRLFLAREEAWRNIHRDLFTRKGDET